MIEKWKDEEDFDSLLDWCDKVKLAIDKYHTDKLIAGHLSMDDFEDSLYVRVENSNLIITLNEELYETTDMRDSNIQVLKFFVEEELPYYVFDTETDLEYGEHGYEEHGFKLIFKLKEGC